MAAVGPGPRLGAGKRVNQQTEGGEEAGPEKRQKHRLGQEGAGRERLCDLKKCSSFPNKLKSISGAGWVIQATAPIQDNMDSQLVAEGKQRCTPMSDEAVLLSGNLVLWEARDRHSCTLVLGLAQAGQVLQSSKMLMLRTDNAHMGAHKEIHAHASIPTDVQAQT